MHSKMTAKQIIDFNKAVFDNTFDAIAVLQDHAEKMMNLFLHKSNIFPLDSKKMIMEWIEASRKCKEDFKKSVDDSFKTVDGFFLNLADEKGVSIYSPTEKTDQAIKENTNKMKKASYEDVDESTPTVADIADDAAKRNSIAEEKTLNKSKSGTSAAKALSKTAKTRTFKK